MRPCQIGSTDNSSQIVRILNSIQQEEEGRFSLFSGCLQHIFYLGILIGCRIGNHTLMLSCFRHLIQTFSRYKRNNSIVLSCLSDNALNRPVLASVLNKQLVNGFSGAECFHYCIAPLYGQFFVSHENSPILSNPSCTSFKSRSYCPVRYRYPTKASNPVAIL